VICAYTEDRWSDLVAAVESVQRQSTRPREVIVVVDHNPALLERVRRHIRDVLTVESTQPPGISGARNCGIAAAKHELIAFLDDDAIAGADWLALLLQHFDDDKVVGVGGALEPLWVGEQPRWFPDEFNWVVGCTYRGMPESTSPVRNLISANMSVRRQVLMDVGGFRLELGEVGPTVLKCEDTELCIRIGQRWPETVLLYEPRARVHHRVPISRATWDYFRTRCYREGLAKAQVSRFVGMRDGLSSERDYALRTLPRGVLRRVMDSIRYKNSSRLAQAGAIATGFALATAGYVKGRVTYEVGRYLQTLLDAWRDREESPSSTSTIMPQIGLPQGTDQRATSGYVNGPNNGGVR